MTTTPPRHQVPLPGNTHPAFNDKYVTEFMAREVGADGTIQVMDNSGLVHRFRSATIIMPFMWIVWIDEQGRGIAQPHGKFALDSFAESYLRTAPVFAPGAHVEMPLQEGPPQ